MAMCLGNVFRFLQFPRGHARSDLESESIYVEEIEVSHSQYFRFAEFAPIQLRSIIHLDLEPL